MTATHKGSAATIRIGDGEPVAVENVSYTYEPETLRIEQTKTLVGTIGRVEVSAEFILDAAEAHGLFDMMRELRRRRQDQYLIQLGRRAKRAFYNGRKGRSAERWLRAHGYVAVRLGDVFWAMPLEMWTHMLKEHA